MKVDKNRKEFCQEFCHILKGYTVIYKTLFKKHSKGFWKGMTFKINKEMEKEND